MEGGKRVSGAIRSPENPSSLRLECVRVLLACVLMYGCDGFISKLKVRLEDSLGNNSGCKSGGEVI